MYKETKLKRKREKQTFCMKMNRRTPLNILLESCGSLEGVNESDAKEKYVSISNKVNRSLYSNGDGKREKQKKRHQEI